MKPARLQLAQEKLEGQKALERELGSAQLAQCSGSHPPPPDRPVGIQPRRQQQALPPSLGTWAPPGQAPQPGLPLQAGSPEFWPTCLWQVTSLLGLGS